MIKKVFAASAFLSLLAVVPAQAATFVVTDGGAATFAASQTTNPGDKLVTFNDFPTGVPAGISVSGSGDAFIVSDSESGQFAEPFGSDGSDYLAVLTGGTATILDTTNTGYTGLSFYLGSIDTYNTFELLDNVGAVIASYTGSAFLGGPSGDQGLPTTNRLVSFTRGATDPLFGGIRFSSSQNSAEVDNVRFNSPVPEPTTWAMMLVGFGLLGASMRRRKQSVHGRVRFA